MTRKYELTDDTIEVFGRTLHRIRAMRDIPRHGVKMGDIGGYIERESNLSHDGDCWVYGNAEVYGDARVSISPINITGLTWNITITDAHMRIGCEQHTHEEWRSFTERNIAEMDGRRAVRFWREHGKYLLKLCKLHAANVKENENDDE